MIRFSLSCENAHDFEGWFANNADFDTQQKRGLLECPVCESPNIGKALMAPSVATARKKDERSAAYGMAMQAEMITAMREMTKRIKQNAENVGDRFAEEARKIHYKETDERGIYGNASPDEVEALHDEGISVMPLPDIPDVDDLN